MVKVWEMQEIHSILIFCDWWAERCSTIWYNSSKYGAEDRQQKVPLRLVSVFQIHENVFYRQESGQLDPLLTVHDVVLSYNNIEANRNEV